MREIKYNYLQDFPSKYIWKRKKVWNVNLVLIDIMQICIVFKGSLVLTLFDFSILSMIIWLWSYYFTSFNFLVYDVGFIYVFRLNLCLKKVWNWIEQVWKLKKSSLDIWREWRVVTMGTTRNRGLLWWVGTMSRVGTVQSSRTF